MFTTIEGIYKDGKIELSETPLGLDGTSVLVTFLPKETIETHPQVLYGAWQGKVSAELDIASILKEIRMEWTEEAEASLNE